MSMDFLRQVAELATPGSPVPEGALPLRFVLEYATAPVPADEAARIADLLGGEGFALAPVDPDLPRFLALEFPGVERRMAPDRLFAAADALIEPLGLVSSVPDIAATLVAAPENPGQIEGVGDAILNMTCWVPEDDRLPRDWAVERIRARQAWPISTGTGVIVAQPDTGVASHPELDGALNMAKAWNALTGTSDPTDPLSSSMSNPGHGTSTASAVASRGKGKVFGAAPGATVAPIRCLDAVVLGLDPTPVARAIMHAVRSGADIISMSLGGAFHSPVMAAALEQAAQAGLIIVAAGGNCVQPVVVYPARDRHVIALGGVNFADKPWKGSSRGPRIDISAPAENVTVARRRPDDGGQPSVKPSQGTSYATALTAGVAALWVSHFGSDTIRQQAANRRVTVNDLFRAALQASARVPAQWDGARYGAGIVDAAALLALPLAQIPTPVPVEAAPTQSADDIERLLNLTMDQAEYGTGDWQRLGPEAVFLLNDAWMRSRRAGEIPLESPSRPQPSPGMSARMPSEVAEGLAIARAQPLLVQPVAVTIALEDLTRKLAAFTGSSTESSAAMSLESARTALRGDGADQLLSRTEAAMSALDRRSGTGHAERREILGAARTVIRDAAAGRLDESSLTARTVLEALVQLNDRPAYRVVDGSIDPEDPLLGEWGGFIMTSARPERWTPSIGRIDLDGSHAGTGFLVGGNRVMTNRHVLEACADQIASPAGSRWLLRGKVTIDFSDRADGSMIFALTGVVQAGDQPIGRTERLDRLDMALLSVDPADGTLPPALDLARKVDPGLDLMLIGFPARYGTSAMLDPQTGKISTQIGARLERIFGTDFGRKYLSPGRFMPAKSPLPGDTNGWVMAHDATTLGGNSGSAVIQLGAAPAVVELRFSGLPLAANKAHLLGVVDSVQPIDGATWV